MEKRIKRYLRKGIAVGMMLCTVCIMSISVNAEDVDEFEGNIEVIEVEEGYAQPFSLNAVTSPSLSISGGTAKYGVSVYGAGLSNISVTVKLQKKDQFWMDKRKIMECKQSRRQFVSYKEYIHF